MAKTEVVEETTPVDPGKELVPYMNQPELYALLERLLLLGLEAQVRMPVSQTLGDVEFPDSEGWMVVARSMVGLRLIVLMAKEVSTEDPGDE